MTDGVVAYLPWLRRGLATVVDRVDSDVPATPQPRGTLGVSVPFTDAGRTAEVAGLALAGPGEVVGIDPEVVVRTWPRPGVTGAESPYLPLLELSQPDLPWRYTPARADAQDRLRPWCCLIALEEGTAEVEAYLPAGPNRRLPVVRVGTAAPLPRLSQSWAWAHVEVAGVRTPTVGEVQHLVATQPARVVARLLCPRHLRPDRGYLVALVPAFARGVLAGLGRPVPDDVDGMAPAWPDARTGPLDLPVYYAWHFGTGPGGDFESLVDRLGTGPLPPGVGRRDVDVSAPGGGLPAAGRAPLGVEGALRSARMQPSAWDAADRGAWTAALDQRLSLPADLLASGAGPREVALPWYGRWHAGLRTLGLPQRPAGGWPWHQELNADPRLRVAAGVGTEVVQRRQQQLMAGAWAQVQGVREANEELRLAQLARESAGRAFARSFANGDDETVVAVAAPVLAHVPLPGGGGTVHGHLASSRLGVGVLDAAFRRVARPLGPVGRRLERRTVSTELLARVARGEVAAAVPPGLPSPLSTFERAGLRRGSSLDPDRVRTAPAEAGFVPQAFGPQDPLPDQPPVRPGRPSTDPDPFRDALVDLVADLVRPPARPPEPIPVDLAAVAATLRAALDPAVTVTEAVVRRLHLAQPRGAHVDPLDPVLVGPTFPQPMVDALRELGQDWVLPGLDQVPPETLALVLTNRRFVEAYMVGLNHEMNRELLVHEFPTDQRGTPFRRFWDTAGAVPEPPPDIDPIAEWSRTAALGGNGPAPATAEDDRLVLLLRGELLRRYPTTVLTAVEADPGPAFTLTGRELYPVFSGTLQPDVAYFGFDLTAAQARGDGTDRGWYLVLCEQPSETRFGLDESPDAPPMATWADLTWGHVGAGDGYIDLDTPVAPPADPQGSGWATHAAATAVITTQRPVRVAVHARRLLPAAGEPA